MKVELDDGQLIDVLVTIEAADLPSSEYVSPALLLTAAAAEQNICLHSRHHSNKVTRILGS